jgi:hypothetical protein
MPTPSLASTRSLAASPKVSALPISSRPNSFSMISTADYQRRSTFSRSFRPMKARFSVWSLAARSVCRHFMRSPQSLSGIAPVRSLTVRSRSSSECRR